VISAFIVQTAVHETAWLEFFRQSGVQPHIVVYEDLVDRYEETAKEILDYLGFPYPDRLSFGPRKMKRQSDALTEEWLQRTLAPHVSSEEM
jgi:LPS sulfotransferase NodH